jgi:hypothetical protein
MPHDVLRIAATDGPGNRATLTLDGRVIGPWVDELRRVSQQVLVTGAELTLDLHEVAFVGRDGLELIQDLVERGVIVVNCPAFVREQLKALSRS